MKQYEASIEIDGQLEKIEFKTDGNRVEYLWGRYGMTTYIEWIHEIATEEETEAS